jgi:hypothetical protein
MLSFLPLYLSSVFMNIVEENIRQLIFCDE